MGVKQTFRSLVTSMDRPHNRAVSAIFQVFGGAERPILADSSELAQCRGMHRGEVAALAVLVPLTVWLAIGDLLTGVSGFLLAVPLAFVALNLLPFLLRAKSQSLQWKLWLVSCVIWAVFQRKSGGLVGAFAHAWIAVAVLNLAAALVLGWRYSNLVRVLLLVTVHAAAIGIGFEFGWPWALVAGAGIAAVGCWAVLSPGSQWLGPVHLTTASPEVLITLDDGPDPQETLRLLELLDRHHTKAIFFMIGEKVRAHPELAREVIRRGHEIGNHTLTHPQASFWCAGPWRTRREIAGCQDVIEEITGSRPRWFRAPVGHRNFFTHPVARSLGLKVMAWNRRGYDAVERDAAKVLARILPELSPGDIVLLHEATPIAAEVLAAVLESRETLLK